MVGKRRVVELSFATALADRNPAETGACCFVTPPDALRTMGVAWALDLQRAIDDWDPQSALIVDLTAAPGFAFKVLQGGLKQGFCPADDPAFPDLCAYAAAFGATLETQRPPFTETWDPHLPQRTSKRAIKAVSNDA